MNIGEQVINEIIRQHMIRVATPDPETSHVFVWSANSSDQLSALIDQSANVQIPSRVSALFGQALALLGAPDGDDPEALLAWASEKGRQLHSTT